MATPPLPPLPATAAQRANLRNLPLPPLPGLPRGASLVLKARSGQSDFVEVDPTKTLFILKHTTVEFTVAAKNTNEPINYSTAADLPAFSRFS